MATIVKCQVNQYCANTNTGKQCVAKTVYSEKKISDIAIFVLKRDVKLQLTNYSEKKQIGSGTPKTPKTAQ